MVSVVTLLDIPQRAVPTACPGIVMTLNDTVGDIGLIYIGHFLNKVKAGVQPGDTLKDPGCCHHSVLLAFPFFITIMLPSGHKLAAKTADIMSSLLGLSKEENGAKEKRGCDA